MLAAAHSTLSTSAPVRPAAASALFTGVDGDLGHQAELIVGPRREARAHALRVEHAGLVDHVALRMPEAFSMNSTLECTIGSTWPAAISAPRCGCSAGRRRR
jgi:hypothetical protein